MYACILLYTSNSYSALTHISLTFISNNQAYQQQESENIRAKIEEEYLRREYPLDLVPTIEDIQSKSHLFEYGVSVVSHYLYIIHQSGYQQKVAEGIHAKVLYEYQRRGYPQALVPTIEEVQSYLHYFDDAVSIVNSYLSPYSDERVVKEIIPLVECEFGLTGLNMPYIDPLWVRQVLLKVKGKEDDCVVMCICILINQAGYRMADFERLAYGEKKDHDGKSSYVFKYMSLHISFSLIPHFYLHLYLYNTQMIQIIILSPKTTLSIVPHSKSLVVSKFKIMALPESF